jgi:hypothetical protein
MWEASILEDSLLFFAFKTLTGLQTPAGSDNRYITFEASATEPLYIREPIPTEPVDYTTFRTSTIEEIRKVFNNKLSHYYL